MRNLILSIVRTYYLKNQLAMIPQSISFVCSGKLGLSVNLDDDERVTLKSDKNLTLTATLLNVYAGSGMGNIKKFGVAKEAGEASNITKNRIING